MRYRSVSRHHIPDRLEYISNDNDAHLIELLKIAADKEQLDVFTDDVNYKRFGSDGKFMSNRRGLRTEEGKHTSISHTAYMGNITTFALTLYPPMDRKVSPPIKH